MKKFFAVLALVAFLGGMGAPAIAQHNETIVTITHADKDPEKAEKKSEKKSSECTDSKKKSSECTDAKKKSCEKTCDDKKK